MRSWVKLLGRFLRAVVQKWNILERLDQWVMNNRTNSLVTKRFQGEERRVVWGQSNNRIGMLNFK